LGWLRGVGGVGGVSWGGQGPGQTLLVSARFAQAWGGGNITTRIVFACLGLDLQVLYLHVWVCN